MTFEIIAEGCVDKGKIIKAPVIERKLNGYVVLSKLGHCGIFVQNSDIKIWEISEEEKNLPISW